MFRFAKKRGKGTQSDKDTKKKRKLLSKQSKSLTFAAIFSIEFTKT